MDNEEDLNVFERAFLFLKKMDILQSTGLEVELSIVRGDPEE